MRIFMFILALLAIALAGYSLYTYDPMWLYPAGSILFVDVLLVFIV